MSSGEPSATRPMSGLRLNPVLTSTPACPSLQARPPAAHILTILVVLSPKFPAKSRFFMQDHDQMDAESNCCDGGNRQLAIQVPGCEQVKVKVRRELWGDPQRQNACRRGTRHYPGANLKIICGLFAIRLSCCSSVFTATSGLTNCSGSNAFRSAATHKSSNLDHRRGAPHAVPSCGVVSNDVSSEQRRY
jgi:hypothetical protein